MLAIFVSWILCLVKCDDILYPTLEDEQKLQIDLMKGYNKNLRPTNNRSMPTPVGIMFYLAQIKDYDPKKGSFAFVGVFSFWWQSDNMIWNSTEYGGISHTIFSQSEVWLPQLLPGNAHSEIKPIGIGEDLKDIPVRFSQTGDSFWATGGVYEHACEGDITYYPFDYQTCEIHNFPWFFSKDEMFLFPLANDVDLVYFTPNGGWELIDTSLNVSDFDYRRQLMIKIMIRRYSLFYLVSVIVPVIVVSFLNILVFLMPADSGERVSFAVTVLLAMSVFLTIVSDNLPESSQPNISLLSCFLFSDLVVSSLVTVSTILGLRYHHKKAEEPMPLLYKRLTRLYLSCCCKVRGKEKTTTSTVSLARNSKINPRSDLSYKSTQETAFTSVSRDMNLNNADRRYGPLKLPRIILDVQPYTRLNTNDTKGSDDCAGKDSCQDINWQDFASFVDTLSFIWYSLVLFSKNMALILIMLIHTHTKQMISDD